MLHGRYPILIIDDAASETLTRDLLCRSAGASTPQTTSIAAAAEGLPRTRPAAVISDLVMPDADGPDCSVMIAEHVPAPPVVVITALQKLARRVGKRHGPTDLICVAGPVEAGIPRDFHARAGQPPNPLGQERA